MDTDKGGAPKTLSYASALYERMDSEATQDGIHRVWRGPLIAVCRELGIPSGSRYNVINRLRSIGCIEQLARGFRGNVPSVFILHHPPTAERFETFAKDDLTDAPSLDTIARAMEDLRRQIGGINLVDALHNIEQRLQKLESQVTAPKA